MKSKCRRHSVDGIYSMNCQSLSSESRKRTIKTKPSALCIWIRIERKKWHLAKIKSIGLDTKLISERKKNNAKLFPGFPPVSFKRIDNQASTLSGDILRFKMRNSGSGALGWKSQWSVMVMRPCKAALAWSWGESPRPWPQIWKLRHGDKTEI